MMFLFLSFLAVAVLFAVAEKGSDKLSLRYPQLKRPLAVLGRISVAAFWVGVVGGAIYWYNHRPKTEPIVIEELSIEKQIISLSPWSDYTGNRWLVFDESGVFKITAEPYSKVPKDIASGHWQIDRNQNAIVISSPGYSATYRYMLKQDQAYLGDDPVENTQLKDLWFSQVPTSNEQDDGPELSP